MSDNERIRKARALLKDASRAFDADEVREGCRLLWEASRTGISAVAEQRGWPHETRDDLKRTLHYLDHEGDPPLIKAAPLQSYFGKFVTAEMYLEHAVTEDDEWDFDGEFREDDESLRNGQKSIKILIDRLEDEVARDAVSA